MGFELQLHHVRPYDSLITLRRAQIQEKIRDEIAKQVTKEVDVQIQGHLLVTLQQQSTDIKEQLGVVQQSLTNS